MTNTLHNKDRLIIYKLPKTLASINNTTFIPKRYDIIVFVKRGISESQAVQERQLIKRVIALPGEKVVVKDGKITVYNAENPEGFDPDANQAYSKDIPYTSGNLELTVPENEIFVCGDNRPQSLDSRVFGSVPADDIVGKLTMRFYPFSDAGTF